ncbi:MAG: Acyl-CoA dehydrogenase [Syntrophaceae bacterium PtaU1.Bin231]|nr:MAG: Acyl-CoA dehydrogenase [Syntrophaceae bacterium PtaU1.Bin231]
MSNGLVNMRDQHFVLLEQLDIDKLFQSELFKDFSKDILLMTLNEAEKMAVNEILPTYSVGDREGCTLKDGKVTVPACFHGPYRKYVENGWLCMAQPTEVGGQGMPYVMATANLEPCYAANFAFLMYPGLTHGAAGLIEKFGTEEQKNKYMLKMFAGEWTGTMCLTEPGAGSDVGALKTTAKRLPDGKFLITGSKCFISCGDHDLAPNIVHPVLARIEGDPPGTSGISIFIVPKYRVNDDGGIGEFNDVRTGNIEHKMGIKGSATCTLNFGDDGKCIGELLGKEREGMRIMFHMMNEARLEVGMQGLGHSSAAYEHAVQYAKERIQSTPVWEMKNPDAKAVPIIQHPDVRRDLMIMKCYVEGMRAMNYFVAYCMDMAKAYPAEADRWNGFVELLTPVCKAYSSDVAMLVCSKAIDIYGGYGYCSEYPVEQYMRDCKIATLYEGTNGIQCLDLVGRKLGQKKGMNVMNLVGEIAGTIAKAKQLPELKKYAEKLEEANNALIDLTMTFAGWGKSASFLLPILNASPYLDLFGDVVLGHFLLQAGTIAQQKLNALYAEKGIEESIGKKRALLREDKDAAFYAGKIASAKFFAAETLATVKARCESIKTGEKIPIEMADESFTV